MGTIGYGYGSEWALLQYLGRRRGALTATVEGAAGLNGIQWLDGDEHIVGGAHKVAEHKGLRFLDPSDPVRTAWEAIWPQSGNVHNWDAVGRARLGTAESCVLLEAKAHLGEVTSSCTASEASMRSIRTVLDGTKNALGANSGGDWATTYYQAANRVALLHFLVERGVDAHLVFLYFTGDRMDLGSPGRSCPADRAGWHQALAAQEAHLGLPSDAPIKRRIHSLFLPALRIEVAEGALRPDLVRSDG